MVRWPFPSAAEVLQCCSFASWSWPTSTQCISTMAAKSVTVCSEWESIRVTEWFENTVSMKSHVACFFTGGSCSLSHDCWTIGLWGRPLYLGAKPTIAMDAGNTMWSKDCRVMIDEIYWCTLYYFIIHLIDFDISVSWLLVSRLVSSNCHNVPHVLI